MQRISDIRQSDINSSFELYEESILGYDTLSNFVVGKKIGKGQFSEVYKAQSKCDGRIVALKKVQLFHMMDAKSSVGVLNFYFK